MPVLTDELFSVPLAIPSYQPDTLLSWSGKVTVMMMRRRQSSGRGIRGVSSDGINLKARKHCFRGEMRLIFY